jgi:hypothetical protein
MESFMGEEQASGEQPSGPSAKQNVVALVIIVGIILVLLGGGFFLTQMMN